MSVFCLKKPENKGVCEKIKNNLYFFPRIKNNRILTQALTGRCFFNVLLFTSI